MAVSNKENQEVSRRMPGRTSPPLWKELRYAVSPERSARDASSLSSREPGVRPEDFPGGLRELIRAALVVRGRILANRFLQGWVRWWFWALVGLLAAAALIPKLASPLMIVAAALAAGAIVVIVRNWQRRPSPYEAARWLDSAAGLHDRLSTAVYLGTAPNPDEMILCQRKDALKHLARVNPRSYFSVRLPDAARRTAVLAVVVGGLLLYRVYHRPPVIALLQGMARSHAVQAVLNPFKQDVQAEIRKMLTLAGQTVDAMSEETKREVDAKDSQGNLWEKNQMDSAARGDDQRQGMPGQGPGNQSSQSGQQMNGQKSRNGRQQGGQQSSSQNNQSNGTNEKANSQQQTAGNSQGGHESFTQSLFQKLKNLLSSSQKPQKGDNKNNKNQSRPSQRPQQSAKSQQSGQGKQGNNQQQSGGPPSAQQKRMTKLNGTGAGNQQGFKQLKKQSDARPASTQTEQVTLQNNGSNDNLRVRISAEVGTAKVPLGSAAPHGVAAIKGAEQENIPARYRIYIQRYFDHSDAGAR